jgi:hypothetical protein
MNLLKQVEPLHKPRFRLPLTEACTPRSVAIHLGLEHRLKRASDHHAQSRDIERF